MRLLLGERLFSAKSGHSGSHNKYSLIFK